MSRIIYIVIAGRGLRAIHNFSRNCINGKYHPEVCLSLYYNLSDDTKGRNALRVVRVNIKLRFTLNMYDFDIHSLFMLRGCS